MRYLVDTSVFSRLEKPAVADAVRALFAEGQLAMCAPVAFELGFSARNPTDYDSLMMRLGAMPWLPTTDGDHARALDIQARLAAAGAHRALSLVDALVAAVAESRDVAILHYDADFERIAEVTGQRHSWAVPRGMVD